jgi:hypothetical protein
MPTDANAAYVSNNNGVSWSYGPTPNPMAAGTSHFYRDVTFPAGQTAASLTFRYNAFGENSWDEMLVYLCPTTLTPAVNSPSGSSTAPTWTGTGTPVLLGRYNLLPAGSGSTINVPINPTVLGNCASSTTWRLVFTWKNDGTLGTSPPAAIDDIMLVSATSPITLAGGTFTIDNTLPTFGTNFQSFTEAIIALNSANACGPFVGPIVFNVTSGQTFAELPPMITATGDAVNTITFQKSGAGANPVITPTGTTATTDAAISIFGGDYFTFDGIDVNASAGTAMEFGYLLRNALATNGSQFNTIKNCNVTMNRTNTASRGFSMSLPTTPTSALGANSNNSFLNFTIKNVYAGIQFVGNATWPDVNNVIGTTACSTVNSIGDAATSNDIGNATTATYGISVSNQSGISIFNNAIRNVTNTGGQADGIIVATFQGTSSVYNNSVQGIRNAGTASTTAVSGLRLSHTTTGTHSLRVYNNTISGISSGYTGAVSATRAIKGIFIVGTGGTTTQNYQIHNNTVSIDGSSSLNISSVCFETSTSTGPIYTLSNNVFANFTATQTGVGRHIGLFSPSATAFGPAGSLSNNNDIYIANNAGVTGFAGIGNATTYTTVANWSTAMTPAGQEAASISIDPLFLNNTSNLHATSIALNNSGMALQPYVTVDLDCAPRTDNDMGAFLITACSGAPTAGTVSGITSICSGLNTNLTLTGASSEAGISYQWASSLTPGGPYGTLMGTGLTQNTGAVTAPTYYTVTVTCSVSGLTAISNEHAISVNALPTVSVSPTTGLICIPGGASIPLTATGTATTYTWSPVNGLSATTGTSTVASPTSTTTYVVTGTDAIGCTSSASSVITVAQNPVITSLTATPNAVCLGGSSQLNATAVLPALLISEVTVFRTGTGATAVYPAYATGADLVEISNITSGAIDISGYTLSAYANNNGTASHTLTFPVGTIIPGNSVAIVCLGTGTNDLVNRYFNTGGTSDSYSSTSQVGVVLKNGSAVVDAVGLGGSVTGSYTFNAGTGVTAGDFSGFAPNGSGLAGSRRTVSVDNNLGTDWTASGAANLQTIGTYDAIYLLPGTITYAWTPATFLDNAAISNPLASGITGTTAYTVTATSSSTCSTTGTVTVSQGIPLTSSTSASPNASICAGTNVTLQVSATGGGAPYTYAWTGPNSFASTAQNPVLTSVTALEDGVYTVVVSDNCGSTSTSTLTITVNPIPVVGVTPTTALFCAPGTAITMTSSGADTYSWSPATGLSATTGSSVDASPATNTVYTVTGTTLAGCTSTATATINNSVSVSMNSISATPSSICNGDNSVLVASASLNSPSTYCASTHANGCSGDNIANVSLGSISNATGTVCGGTTFYTYFAASPTTTTTLTTVGGPYSLSLTFGTDGNQYFGAWIDYNQNGSFEVSEFLGASGNAGASGTTAVSFSVPVGALNGVTRMRIIGGNDVALLATQACGASSSPWGETQDYDVTISGGVDPLTYAWTPSTFLSSTNTATTTATAATTTTAYTLTATSAGGCIATGTTTVTVNQPTTSTINPVACVTYTSPNGSVYTTSGTYVNVIPNAAGCDSTITINLTINQPTTSTINPIVCDTYTSPNGSVYTTSGTYVNVIPNTVGCDSTITINLTVNNSTTSTITPVVCGSYTSPNGSVYASSGTYTNVIPNAVGCDSTITINLTVYGNSSSTISPVVCDTYTSPNGSVYTNSGTYTNVIPNFIGCDSTITINLTVNYSPAVSAGNDMTVCQNGQVTLFGSGASTYTWTNGVTNGVPFVALGTATYSVTGTSAAGCTSSDAVTVTVNPLPVVEAGANISQCGDQNVTLNGSGAQVYTWNNGVVDGVSFNAPFGTSTYIVTGVDAFGCSNNDVVTVVIGEIPVATATAVDALSIMASPANSFYQWIDCSTNAPIFGATGSTYTATENGSYAVIVTNIDGCSDTSACVIVDEVGLNTLSDEMTMTVYPNPTNGNLYVSLSSIEKVNINVFDAQGKLIQTIIDAQNKSIIDLNNAEPGVYMIHMNSENSSTIQRIVKN